MSEYYTKTYVKSMLADHTDLQEYLYIRGFLITDEDNGINLDDYPFYGNWQVYEIDSKLRLFIHHLNNCYICRKGNTVFFLIGHAYNPFTEQYLEMDILNDLSEAYENGWRAFWKKESELTGIFCIGYANEKGISFSTDCTGMQTVYYGRKDGHIYVSSHSKLIADLCDFVRDDYISRLVNSRYYHYFGTWLPGDLSPFKEVIRTQPNFEISFTYQDSMIRGKRYFPVEKIEEIKSEQFDATIKEIADILASSMKMTAEKWPDKRAAVSVTGGKDSTTTLACANGLYDKFSYFSYISSEAEAVDAKAADQICEAIGVKHHTYVVPDESELYKDIELYKVIFECNAGCIGHNNLNDVKKRIFFSQINDFDVEVKSWVNEICRGWFITKYNKQKFPERPTPAYLRSMWKVMVNPRLIHESNQVFKNYLKRYYNDRVFNNMSWLMLYYWEFSWSGGEGLFLSSEHKFSYDITIPYNNRLLLEKMLTIPVEMRIPDEIPDHVTRIMNPIISETNISVHNISHTKLWSNIQKAHLEIFSKMSF